MAGVTGRRSADRSSASERHPGAGVAGHGLGLFPAKRQANLVGVTNIVAKLSQIAPSWTGIEARDALLAIWI
jgi:hypothetical protein